MPKGNNSKVVRKAAAKKAEANRSLSPDAPQHKLLAEWTDNEDPELVHYLVCMYVPGTVPYENIFIFSCRRANWKEGIFNPLEVKRVKTSLELRQIMNWSRVKMDEDQRQNVMFLTTCLEGGEKLGLIAKKVSEEHEKSLETEAIKPDAKKVTPKSNKRIKDTNFSAVEAVLGQRSHLPEGFKNFMRQKLIEFDHMTPEEKKIHLKAIVLSHVKNHEDEAGISSVTQEEIDRMENEVSFKSFINKTRLILEQLPKDSKPSVMRVMAKDEIKARRVERATSNKENKFRNKDLRVPRKHLDAIIANYLTQKLTQLYDVPFKK